MKLILSVIAIIAVIGFFSAVYTHFIVTDCIVKGGNITESYRCVNPDGQYID